MPALTLILGSLFAMNTAIKQQEFNFNQLKNKQVMLINDSVMGGLSSSKFEIKNRFLKFYGSVSLKNNGGFASLRMVWPYQNSKDFNRLRLKIIGDGKTYQFRLRTSKDYDGAAYVFEFKTIKDKSIYIDMNAKQFIPSFRGRTLTDMPQLMLKDVKQMGLLIADNQVGDFSIKLEKIIMINP